MKCEPCAEFKFLTLQVQRNRCFCQAVDRSLRIQVCPTKGINPTILLWGWDWDHQTYSREGYGSLGDRIVAGEGPGSSDRKVYKMMLDKRCLLSLLFDVLRLSAAKDTKTRQSDM